MKCIAVEEKTCDFQRKKIERIVCLFVLEFYGPVNNEVNLSRSVNSVTVPEQA